MQGGLTYDINEQLKNIPPESVLPYALGLLGISTCVNAAVEAFTLKKKGYSANAFSTRTYLGTRDAVKSVIIGNTISSINWADGLALIAATVSFFNGEGVNNTVPSDLIAKSIVSMGYWNILNILLMNDRLGFINDKVYPVYEKFEREVKNVFRRNYKSE